MLKVSGNFAGSLTYQSTWNASTNTPTLVSSVGTKGFYYVVSVAGNTNLNGITSWNIGDWAVFDGSVWEKVDNNQSVTSVNGQTGTVVLGATDVGATPNTTYVIAGTALSGGGQLTGNVTINLANTTVASGTYGNATTVARVTVDAQGRLTNVTNVAISISNTAVANLGTMSVQNANAVAITGGTLDNVSIGGTTTNNANIATATVANLTVTGGTKLNSLTGYVFANNTSNATASTTIPVANVSGAVPNTVYVIAGTNLTGGGALTGNVTINSAYNGTVTNVATGTGLTGGPVTTTGTISLANTTVTAGSYGNASSVATFTVDPQGRLNAASNVAISINVAAVLGAVPNTRTITASTGLTGGGNLSADISLAVSPNTTQQLVMVQNNGVNVASRQIHNFIPGNNITITSADDSANGRANVTIATSGLGTMATQNANNVTITGGTINGVSLTLDSIDNTPIGNTTDASANVTTLKASGNLTFGAYTGYLYANGSGANVTASSTIPNANLANSTITLGNTTLTLGATTTSVGNLTVNNVTIPSGSINVQAVNHTSTTTATATFATASLPLVPAGYIQINLNGTVVKVPYYAV